MYAMINMRSAFWAITILLFLGGLGILVPENPALMGGGYALHKHLSPPLASLFVWYLAVMAGDSLLFDSSHWLFTRPTLSELLDRYVGWKRLEEYRTTFIFVSYLSSVILQELSMGKNRENNESS